MPKGFRVLLAAAIVAAAAGACGQNDRPASRPATSAAPATTTPKSTEPDIKPVVVRFLHSLPADGFRIAADEVARRRPVVVDVRTDEEYARGAIAGAIHVELHALAASLPMLPPRSDEIVLVCEHGYRGAIGMAVLQMLGYSRARSLEGGMAAWRAAGLPVDGHPSAMPRTPVDPRVDPQLRAALDYYLTRTLQKDFGAMEVADLVEDQLRKSSAEIEEQPETFDQGKSLLVVAEDRDAFTRMKSTPLARAKLSKAINLPLREVPDLLETMPLQETVNWA